MSLEIRSRSMMSFVRSCKVETISLAPVTLEVKAKSKPYLQCTEIRLSFTGDIIGVCVKIKENLLNKRIEHCDEVKVSKVETSGCPCCQGLTESWLLRLKV